MKKLETKKMLIDERNYKDMTICFEKQSRMLSLYYHQLMRKNEKYEEKNLITDDYMLNEVLDKIKKDNRH